MRHPVALAPVVRGYHVWENRFQYYQVLVLRRLQFGGPDWREADDSGETGWKRSGLRGRAFLEMVVVSVNSEVACVFLLWGRFGEYRIVYVFPERHRMRLRLRLKLKWSALDVAKVVDRQ